MTDALTQNGHFGDGTNIELPLVDEVFKTNSN